MLKFEIHRQPDALFANAEAWNRLAGGNPFLETHWLGPWWRRLGSPHEALIIAARDQNGELAGALPLYRIEGGRTLGVMSDGQACGDYMRPLCTGAAGIETAAAIGQFLGQIASDHDDGWDALDFDGGVEGDAMFSAMIAGLRQAGCSTHVSSRVSCWRRPRNLTWTEHLRQHGKTQRRKMRRYLEKIGQNGLTANDPTNARQFESLVNDVIDLHQKRWASADQPGSFALPEFRQFAVESMLNFYCEDRALVHSVALDGRTIAGELIIVGTDRVAYTYSAGYDVQHAAIEPGRIVTAHSLHQMYEVDARYDAIDFLRGDEAYKNRFASESRRVYRLRAFAPEAFGQLRSAAYRTNFQVKQWLRRATGRDEVTVAQI